MMDITAIVLAGGQGSRMNFQEKAWLLHHGKPLIRYVIDGIAPHVETIVISRNRDHPGYETQQYTCVADESFSTNRFSTSTKDDAQRFEGPLAGVVACLPHITTSFALIVPCDTPALPDTLVPRLIESIGEQDVCIVHDGQQEQPLICLARVSTLHSIADYLATGRRSVKGWLETVEYTRAHFRDTPVAFENINEPEQLGLNDQT